MLGSAIFLFGKALTVIDASSFSSLDSNSEAAIIQGCPSLEICNSKFTSNYGEWALGFCGGIYDKDNADCAHQRDHPLETVTSLDLSNRSIRNLMNKVRPIQTFTYFPNKCAIEFIMKIPLPSLFSLRILSFFAIM